MRLRYKPLTAVFAAVLGNGGVVTWAENIMPNPGALSAEQDQLKNVQQTQFAAEAFAAIRADGRVVSWGQDSKGGDSSTVKHQLANVPASDPGSWL